MSGSLCGYFIFAESISTTHAIGIAIISLLLFITGMGCNDIVDLKKDKILRPERPLPSGLIELKHAIIVCFIFTVIAIAISCFMSTFHLITTLCLTLFILIYNCYAKHNILASISITACRVCNIILGIGSLDLDKGISIPIIIIALHTFSIMKMADGEDESSELSKLYYLFQGLIIVLLGIINIKLFILWVIFLFFAMRKKVWTQRGDRIKTVGELVMGFCVLDAVILCCYDKTIYASLALVFWFLSKSLGKKLRAG